MVVVGVSDICGVAAVGGKGEGEMGSGRGRWKKRGKSCTQNIDVGDVLANYRDTQQSQAEDKRPCAPYKVQSIIKSHPNACFEEGSKEEMDFCDCQF